jgi:hypothetical protein
MSKSKKDEAKAKGEAKAKVSKKAKDKVALYVEIPPDLKAAIEKLADEHNRKLSGEVVTALQRYVAQEEARRQSEKGGK